MTFLFIGERPSRTAAARGWRWEHGRLAAKQLFDALVAVGERPGDHLYDNVFLPNPDGPPTVSARAVRRARRAHRRGVTVVALGRLVAAVLVKHAITHLQLTHPAARGRIRAKAAYAAHVKAVLVPSPGKSYEVADE